MNIPPEAITAAARALNPRAYSEPADVIGLTLYRETTEDTQKRLQTEARHIATTALTAALPHIRDQIATEILAHVTGKTDYDYGLDEAARIAKEGAPS